MGTAAAERLVECLLLSARQRAPDDTSALSWASSRRILCGDVFEPERGDLAMTDDEAHELLAGIGKSGKELVEVAQGWPTVLGLASMVPVPLLDLSAAPHLYGFFEEIYQRIDRPVRRVLCMLALYDADGRRLAIEQLRSDEAERSARAPTMVSSPSRTTAAST